jgi:hypothetical protein
VEEGRFRGKVHLLAEIRNSRSPDRRGVADDRGDSHLLSIDVEHGPDNLRRKLAQSPTGGAGIGIGHQEPKSAAGSVCIRFAPNARVIEQLAKPLGHDLVGVDA